MKDVWILGGATGAVDWPNPLNVEGSSCLVVFCAKGLEGADDPKLKGEPFDDGPAVFPKSALPVLEVLGLPKENAPPPNEGRASGALFAC